MGLLLGAAVLSGEVAVEVARLDRELSEFLNGVVAFARPVVGEERLYFLAKALELTVVRKVHVLAPFDCPRRILYGTTSANTEALNASGPEARRSTVTVTQKKECKAGEGDDQTDGRRRRSAQSRIAIVDAMFALIGEGDLRPSAQRVADRAGVGIRTVFRHFDEMDRLYAEMNARLRETLAPLLAGAGPTGGLSKRARDLVATRCDAYERMGPFKRSANLHRQSSPFLQKTHRAMVRDMRADLDRWLPELESVPARLSNAFEAAVSFEAWDRLRTDQKLSQKDTREAIETLVEALVAASQKSRS